MYYAMTDRFSGDYPREYTAGFANTKEPLGFKSKKERDEWLKTTKLTTAKPLSRKEAISLAKNEIGDFYGHYGSTVKVARLHEGYGENIILRIWKTKKK